MEQTNNTFTEGLNKDLNPIATPNNVLTDALNATLITFNGNEMMLLNDMGNTNLTYYPRTWEDITDGTTKDKDYRSVAKKILEKVKLSDGFIPIGIKEHGDIIYIISYNPSTKLTEIGSFPGPEYRPFDKEPEYSLDDIENIKIDSIESLNKIYIITDYNNTNDTNDAFLKARDYLTLKYKSYGTVCENESSKLGFLNLISDNNNRKLFNIKILNTLKNKDLSNNLKLSFNNIDDNNNYLDPNEINFIDSKTLFYPNTSKGNLGLKIELEDIDDFYTAGYPEINVLDINDYYEQDQSGSYEPSQNINSPKDERFCIKLDKLLIKNYAEFLKVDKVNITYKLYDYNNNIVKLEYLKSYNEIIEKEEIKYSFERDSIWDNTTELKYHTEKELSLKNITNFPGRYHKEEKEGQPDVYTEFGIVIPLKKTPSGNILNRELILHILLEPETETYIGIKDSKNRVDLSKYNIELKYDLSKSIDQLLGEQKENTITEQHVYSIGNIKINNIPISEMPYKDVINSLFGDINNYKPKTKFYYNGFNDTRYCFGDIDTKITHMSSSMVKNLEFDDDPTRFAFIADPTGKYNLSDLNNGNIPSYRTSIKDSNKDYVYITNKMLIFSNDRDKNSSVFCISNKFLEDLILYETNIKELNNFNLMYNIKFIENSSMSIIYATGASKNDDKTLPVSDRTNLYELYIANGPKDNRKYYYKRKGSFTYNPDKALIEMSGQNAKGVYSWNNGSSNTEIKEQIEKIKNSYGFTIKKNLDIYYNYALISRDENQPTLRKDYLAAASLGINDQGIVNPELSFPLEFIDNPDGNNFGNFEEHQAIVSYVVNKIYIEGESFYINNTNSIIIDGDNMIKDEYEICENKKNSYNTFGLNFISLYKLDSYTVKIKSDIKNPWKIFSCYIEGDVSISVLTGGAFYFPNNKLETNEICKLDSLNRWESNKGLMFQNTKLKRLVILTNKDLTLINNGKYSTTKIFNPIVYEPNIYTRELDINPQANPHDYIEQSEYDLNNTNNKIYYCGNFTGPSIKNITITGGTTQKEYFKRLDSNNPVYIDSRWMPLPFYDLNN